MEEEQIELTTTEVRAGTTPHIVRYILALSLALIVVAMAIILAISLP
jgi:hypothetical protein